MWESIEARLNENERERPLAMRRTLFDVFRNSGLRPGGGVTKKMVSFEFGEGERLLWEVQNPANIFLHGKWQERLEASGFISESRPFHNGMKDGGRHSALSRDWSFRDADCIVIRIDEAETLRRLLSILMKSDRSLVLDPTVVARWIERLRHFFPALDRFDRPDSDFDDAERNYKLATSEKLRAALDSARDDPSITEAVYAAIGASNLLDWRTSEPLSPKSNADHGRLDRALASLVRAALGSPEVHAAALDDFADVWKRAVPNGTEDAARQIGEFLFFHLWPDQAVYIRHTVRQDLWREAVGTPFPKHSTLAETYADEVRFMQAVRQAFKARGLAPRDMIDVQSALWVVHNYQIEDGAMSQTLDRAQIEVAMDAYDSYRKDGTHSDVFDAFGEPRDFWVRSSRERANRVYPTKPIVAFAKKLDGLNGGWSTIESAAAALHNAGFVVVNAEDQPVDVPEKGYLLSGADRIRLCALNYFIELAREKVFGEVSIRAGDLAAALGVKDALPNICQALGGKKFQRLAKVPRPTSTEPNPSSTTVFTYTLSPQLEAKTMIDPENTASPSAENLILYGPPGTGKTYQTAWEAVRLCIGDEAAAALKNDRNALTAEYQRLANEARIEFVTFHQSLSYEEFVEGLRPDTGDNELEGPDEQAGALGFQLKCHDGIFKRISERARLDRGEGGETQRLNRSARIFKVALGQRNVEDDRIQFGLDNDLIHLGWGDDIDWSDQRFDAFDEIVREWKSKKDRNATGHDGNIVCTYSFRADMQVGDYVVVSDGRDRIQAFGQVSGEYFFDPEATFHPHRRKVEWLWRSDEGIDRSKFYPNWFRRHSVYKLNQSLIDWDALEALSFGEDVALYGKEGRDYVLIIDEINRANISKVFGELITLLEKDKRLGEPNEVRVQLPYSKKRFGVPSNLHIVGTMNTADRSIALLDTALRRRFTFQELMPDPSILSVNIGGINLRKLLSTINERIEYLFDREHQIGHAYFIKCENRADIVDVMRHQVIPLLAEYFYEDWSKVAAVLGDKAGVGKTYFLAAKKLSPPTGFKDDEMADEKLRWSVKAEFDFSEFEA